MSERLVKETKSKPLYALLPLRVMGLLTNVSFVPNRCSSYWCRDGTCHTAAGQPRQPATWVYIVVALCIALRKQCSCERSCCLRANGPSPCIVMIGIGVGLWLWHKKSRERNRIKLDQYESEQVCRTASYGRQGEIC